MSNPDVDGEELRHIAWKQLGLRVDPKTPDEQIHEILQYKRDEVPDSPINKMRDEIILFIKRNRNRLILSCDGDCYQHHDGVVIHCYMQFKEKKQNG